VRKYPQVVAIGKIEASRVAGSVTGQLTAARPNSSITKLTEANIVTLGKHSSLMMVWLNLNMYEHLLQILM